MPIGAIGTPVPPEPYVEVYDTAVNIGTIFTNYKEKTIRDLRIYRPLYRDGYFNTLCLPFSMTEGEIDASPITGAQIYRYVRAEKDGSGLLIYMSPVSTITAGEPYLVKWNPTEPEIIPMPLEFQDVFISRWQEGDTIGAPGEIRFAGNIAIGTVTEYNENHLFIGAENTLYWPEGDSRLRGFRAHFRVPITGPGAAPKHTPARIVVRQDTPTDIDQITNDQSPITNKIIKDNRLIIIRDGKRYNVLGLEL